MSGKSSCVWDYFDKNEVNKRATCKFCHDNYSYASTIANLKQHLIVRHRDVCPDEFIYPPTKKTPTIRTASNMLWGYFTKLYDKPRVARCNICHNEKSYKTSITNLKTHLATLHPEAYERFAQNLPPKFDEFKTTCKSNTNSSDNSDDDNDEELQQTKINDIWTYFEQEGSTKVRCVVCHEIISNNDYEYLKAHLFEHHPKLLLRLVTEQEEKQEIKSNPATEFEDNDNTYTEIVYLEQDSGPEDTRPLKEIKKQHKYRNTAKKRARITSSDDHVSNFKKVNIEQPEPQEIELDAFIKYIRCLLKKLTPDAFSKVQIDILKTIMDAQYLNKVTVTNNSSTSNILAEIAKGNVENVIRVSEVQDSSSLLTNYTVTIASNSDDRDSKQD